MTSRKFNFPFQMIPGFFSFDLLFLGGSWGLFVVPLIALSLKVGNSSYVIPPPRSLSFFTRRFTLEPPSSAGLCDFNWLAVRDM